MSLNIRGSTPNPLDNLFNTYCLLYNLSHHETVSKITLNIHISISIIEPTKIHLPTKTKISNKILLLPTPLSIIKKSASSIGVHGDASPPNSHGRTIKLNHVIYWKGKLPSPPPMEGRRLPSVKVISWLFQPEWVVRGMWRRLWLSILNFFENVLKILDMWMWWIDGMMNGKSTMFFTKKYRAGRLLHWIMLAT